MSFDIDCSKKVIQKAQKGDKFALTQIYQLYKRAVYSFALRMLHDEHRANDVLQIVMFKMMQTINTVTDTSKFNGWIKRVTYNVVIDMIRANSKLTHIDNDTDYDYSVKESLSVINSARWDLEQFLSILDDRERLVVWLYSVEGFSHKDIAGKLELSEQNSRVIFSRAMKAMKLLTQDERYAGQPSGVFYE